MGCGAVIYYINNKAAKILVDDVLNNGINTAIDWFMYDKLNQLTIGIIKEPLVKTNNFKSLYKK